MHLDSVKEYEFVRREMDNLKSCVTTYVGFVIGGVGAAIFGFAKFAPGGPLNVHGIAYSSLALAVIVTFVLSILLYKFNSHNRFAGYCIVLSHEHLAYPKPRARLRRFRSRTGRTQPPTPLTWEIAIGQLRAADLSNVWPAGQIDRLGLNRIDEKRLCQVLAYYTGGARASDRWRFLRGLYQLVGALFGLTGTRSWGFPPVVVAIFLMISAGLLGTGMTLSYVVGNDQVLFALAYVITALHLVVWCRVVCKFHDMMSGSATTVAFAWRFLPIRANLLIKHGLKPTFPFIRQELRDEVLWIVGRQKRRLLP